jgi:hypothetical protein
VEVGDVMMVWYLKLADLGELSGDDGVGAMKRDHG